jgi:hypothetical protein
MHTHQLVHIEDAFTGCKRFRQLVRRALRQTIPCTQHHIVILTRAFCNYLVHCHFLLCPFDVISITQNQVTVKGKIAQSFGKFFVQLAY